MYCFNSFSVEVKPQILIRSQPLSLPCRGCLLVIGGNGVGKTTFLKQVGKSLLSQKSDLKISFVSSIQVYEKGLPLLGQEFLRLFTGKAWPAELENKFGNLLVKRIDQMSSGEFQALVLISNFMEESDVLLVDEPISHLSPEWALFFADWMNELRRQKLLIIASHQIDLLNRISDQIYEIKNQTLFLKVDTDLGSHNEFV